MNYVDFCVVGLGPAGLGAALKIAGSKGRGSTLCLESGLHADLRSCSILQNQNCRWAHPCHILAGVGGAALMSSGKVSNYPAGQALRELIPQPASAESLLDEALAEFEKYVPVQKHDRTAIECKQALDYYSAKGFHFRYYPAHRFTHAHIVAGLGKMMEAISAAGIHVQTQSLVTDIRRSNQGYELSIKNQAGNETVFAKRVLLATGRSGRRLVSRLLSTKLLAEELGSVDLGLRLEFSAPLWSTIDLYHNDLKLHFEDARTFCVCKAGTLAPYRVGSIFLMEGHSDPAVQSPFTNLAITVRLAQSPNSLPIFENIQRRLVGLSGGWPVAQTLRSYLESSSSRSPRAPAMCSIKHWRLGAVRDCFDENTNGKLHRALDTFATAFLTHADWENISVFAPEVDYYWPRLQLKPGLAADSVGLFVAGDAAGRFRGILQAFATGIQVATQVLGAQHD